MNLEILRGDIMDLVYPWNVQVIIGSVLAGIIVLYVLWTISVTRRAWQCCGHHVHFLKGIPILGNALLLIGMKSTSEIWDFVTDVGLRYRQGMMCWLLHMPWLILSDLEVIEVILSSPECTEKGYIYKLLDTITDGVFIAQGLRWKKLRKRLNLTFSQRQLDMIYDDVNEQTAICIDVLKKNTGKYINIISFMTTYFFDVVTRTHYGVESYQQTERDVQTPEVAAKIIEITLGKRMFNPPIHFKALFAWTRMFRFIKDLRRGPLNYLRELTSMRMKQLEIEKDHQVLDEKKRMFFLDSVKEILEEQKVSPTPYRLERNTGDILVAGSDTTSIGVSSAFYYLAYYPEIQEKVYQEALSIYGDQSTKQLTREDLNRMEYLEMVIKETLRHTSPAGIVREVDKEFDVGKYIIPKGTSIFLALKSVHMNPEYYEKPEEFYPEHFTPEKIRERPKFAFLAFSQGPRNCPGKNYSYITMKSIISSVVRNFKLETNMAKENIKYKIVLMQEHTNGYYIKLTPRM